MSQQRSPQASRSSNPQARLIEARRASVSAAATTHSQRMVRAVLEAFAQLEAERLASVAPHGDDEDEPSSGVRKATGCR